MASQPDLILAVPPALEAQALGESPAALGHMAYRLLPGPRLARLDGRLPGSGGYLCLSPEGQVTGDTQMLYRQLVRECRGRNFRGVILDLPPGMGEFAQTLARALEGQNLETYLPEAYASLSRHTHVMISTALSGGSLRERLEGAIQQWGRERVVPALECRREDFTMPALNGSGVPLTGQDLKALMERRRPASYWSGDLCGRYFTYLAPDGAHFVLYDDPDTLRAQRRLAGELGLGACIAAWEDWART